MVTGQQDAEEDYSIIQVGPSVARRISETERARQDYINEKTKVEKAEEKKNRPLTKREKHKAEKIKRKYRDQDEEERELRLKLLASRPAQPPQKNSGMKLTSNFHSIVHFSFRYQRHKTYV